MKAEPLPILAILIQATGLPSVRPQLGSKSHPHHAHPNHLALPTQDHNRPLRSSITPNLQGGRINDSYVLLSRDPIVVKSSSSQSPWYRGLSPAGGC